MASKQAIVLDGDKGVRVLLSKTLCCLPQGKMLTMSLLARTNRIGDKNDIVTKVKRVRAKRPFLCWKLEMR